MQDVSWLLLTALPWVYSERQQQVERKQVQKDVLIGKERRKCKVADMVGAEEVAIIVEEIITIKEKSMSLNKNNMKVSLRIRTRRSEALFSENPN